MVTQFMQRGLSVMGSKQTNIFSAAFFIILTTVFSQILGFVKYRLLVAVFGASADLGVFLASFRIPDFIFQVLIAGAMSSAFIPIFSEYLGAKDEKKSFGFASSVITLSLVAFCSVATIIAIFSYPLSSLIAPGFSDAELTLMANLSRIILLSQVFFVLGLIVTSMLQSFQHFLIPGIASSFYNLGIIVGILVLSPFLGIYGACFGVLVGSFFFLMVQLPFLRRVGFSFSLSFKIDQSVKHLIHLMIPRSLMLFASQIAAVANVFFASFISARSLVIFDLAQSLMAAPVFLFGQSIATASFPSLSFHFKNRDQFLSIFLSSFYQILYLTLPISTLLIVLRIPIVRLFYGSGRFDWQATVDTGRTLAYFSVSIAAQGLIFLLSRAFYAHKDTKTPFYVTLISVAFHISISYLFILVYKFPIYALALAFSFGNILSLILLFLFLDARLHFPKFEMLRSVSKIVIAAFIMGVSLYVPIKLLDQLVFDTTRTINLLMLTGIASFIGFSSYVFFTWLLNISEAYYIISVGRSIVRKVGDWRKILSQVEEPIQGPKLDG